MVKVGFLEDEPTILAALGVKISQTPFEEGSIEDLYQRCKRNPEESKKLVNRIMEKHGHMILADFLPYAISLEEVSKFAATYIWRNVNCHNLVFGAGIEASFRVVKPNRYNEIVSELGEMAFKVYERATALIPEQDARYLLPEGALTRMVFSAPPRYLIKLANSLKNSQLPELKEIGEKIETLIKGRFGLEIPKEALPSQWEFFGKKDIKKILQLNYQGTIHSLSLNMSVEGSLAMFAQLVRQRQLLCDIEPLEQIAKRGEFVIPPTFPEILEKEYREIAERAKEAQLKLIEEKDPNFVYSFLQGQNVRAIVYVKGAGIVETSRTRSCGAAQWEIRNSVGIRITRELTKYEELKKEIGPRCWREKRCIEPTTFKTRKAVCKVFQKMKGNWQATHLEELLEVLREPYRTFTV